MRPDKPRIGIILDTDMVHCRTFGGASGFVQSILDKMPVPCTIFGIGFQDTIPWQQYQLNPQTSFQAVAQLTYSARIPLRLPCLLGYWRQRRRILKSGVQLLYIHSPEIALPFLFGRDRLPVIFHQHGSENPVTWSKFAWARSTFFKTIYDLIMAIVHRRSDWIIVIDRPSLAQVERQGRAHRASLIMNAIDTEVFYPDEELRQGARKRHGVNEDECVLLFVGRLEEVKRVDRLLAGLAHLMAHFPGRYRLYIAGEGTWRTYLEGLATSFCVAKQVTFLGQVPHQRLPEYYNMADVLVLPSEMEGTPMVILEALACGTPVVASQVGGIPELLQAGKTGVMLESLDAPKLARAIQQIWQARPARHEIAATMAGLSAGRFVEVFLSIARRLLAERS